MTEEAYPQAAAILREAGWKPHDPWGVYTKGTLVMGFSPDGQHFDVKNWGADVHGPDYPDDPVEAAQWLVRLRAVVLETPLTLEPVVLAEQPEPVETPQDERPDLSHNAGPEGDAEFAESELLGASEMEADASVHEEPQEGNWGVVEEAIGADPIDADFTEDLGAELLDEHEADLPALEGADPLDFAPDEIDRTEPDPGGAFIFGDNLHQLRTAAIGLVVQAALNRQPEAIDYARLSELRNFVMGVSEQRWPDDPSKREELDRLEATERQRRAIDTARDAKVAWIMEASREDLAAFDPESDWP